MRGEVLFPPFSLPPPSLFKAGVTSAGVPRRASDHVLSAERQGTAVPLGVTRTIEKRPITGAILRRVEVLRRAHYSSAGTARPVPWMPWIFFPKGQIRISHTYCLQTVTTTGQGELDAS